MKHRITIASTPKGYGRYTYSYSCSCGARGWECSTSFSASQAGKKHQQKAGAR